jgi:hypothetical protein
MSILSHRVIKIAIRTETLRLPRRGREQRRVWAEDEVDM